MNLCLPSWITGRGRRAAVVALGLFAAGASAAEPGAPTNTVGYLTLDNGERFRGTWTALEEDILQWSHPDALKPFRFRLANVREIVFDDRPEVSTPPTGAAITFHAAADGGEARADAALVGMDERTVRLRSPVAGEFDWPRDQLTSIVFPHAGGRVLIGGEVRTNEWVLPAAKSGDPWNIQGDRWISTGRGLFSRQADLPERLRLDLDLKMLKVVHTRIGLYVPNTTNDFRDLVPGYYLEYRPPGNFDVSRVEENGRKRSLRTPLAPVRFPPGNFHVTLFVHRPEGAFVLYVNGRLLAEWKEEPNAPPPAARGVSVTAFERPMEISGLTIREWHGNLASIARPRGGGADDLVYGVDGRQDRGRVEGVRDGILAVATAEGRVSRPLSEVERIDFATAPAGARTGGAPGAPAGLPPWWVFCAEGTVLPMRLETLAGDTLRGTLPSGSPCAVRLFDIRRITNQAAAPVAEASANPPAGPAVLRMQIQIQPR